MATNRPRGFIAGWSPAPPTRMLIQDVKKVLREYEDIAPLTLRQIFYVLHSDYGYEKTEKQYKRMCESMNKARRAMMVSMDDIRDDGLVRKSPETFESEESFVGVVRSYGQRFRLDRQTGQERYLMVWCEARGMLPQLAKYCDEYGVEVISSGGFDSVTTKHNFAKEACELGSVEILHVGDHDPSGVHMHNSLDEDLGAFVRHYGGEITVTRLAVVPEQIEQMRLPQAPAKATDNRSFDGLTTQAEAIPPRRLREIVEDAIIERFDFDLYQEVLDEEETIRASLRERLAKI